MLVEPYRVDVAETALRDLRERIARTRWPSEETEPAWTQGTPSNYLKDVASYWANEYKWRSFEDKVNAFPNYQTNIDGLNIHFIHLPSSHTDAVPLILTHGWPGSIVEFMECLRPLAEPTEHGGRPEDAFHVVCPSLPGYGFSEAPSAAGWNVPRVAHAWDQLMTGLGYATYVAQGGDWGAFVTTSLAQQFPERVRAIHLNWAILNQRTLHHAAAGSSPTSDEEHQLSRLRNHRDINSGYSAIQSTKPQTISYGLSDSPIAQCAWILEKFQTWTDNHGWPEDALHINQILDNITLYWLTNTSASSARLYWESLDAVRRDLSEVKTPTGYTVFPHEIACPSRRWLEVQYPNLRYYNRVDRGGHFAAFEQPRLFAEEVRAAFRVLLSR